MRRQTSARPARRAPGVPPLPAPGAVQGEFAELDGIQGYRILNADSLRPFLISLASAADHWLFLSSTGALTAGRQTPDLALFPYATDDKIHDSQEVTGGKTIVLAGPPKQRSLWEPFSERSRGAWRIQRNLFRSLSGHLLVFEETNLDLELTFQQGWTSSDQFGFIRRCRLSNHGPQPIEIRILDGLRNLMPCGIGSQFQLEKSTLIDAYKRNELLAATGLGLFRLSSIPVDRPEPAEALKTTVAWNLGLPRRNILICSRQLDRFRQDQPLSTETDIRAERGAYLVESTFPLAPGNTRDWLTAADVGIGPSALADLEHRLSNPAAMRRAVDQDVEQTETELRRIVAESDGIQRTSGPMQDARHFQNVLANVMRGGIFDDPRQVRPDDVARFVQRANSTVAARHAKLFRRLESNPTHARLLELAAASGDPALERICREYLPLTFSRRHGDPSRPWNRFAIAPRDPDGRRRLDYEGNWRDVFQNWEALSRSFPAYLPGMICRFVNASTADGYNPYRLTRDGFDWEITDPHDPWSFIGYWGDHQVIYLVKLLELLDQHDPGTLRSFLTRDIFSYAHVPYRIKPHAEILENAKDTVVFDAALHESILRRAAQIGGDGKLLPGSNGGVYQVNLTEKLLVPLLAKYANLIPEAGIWLNTQRPEWNDANNALVGHGASMVTLYYLRRHLSLCLRLLEPLAPTRVTLSNEVRQFLESIAAILRRHRPLLKTSLGDRKRRVVSDQLGLAASRYRETLYRRGLSRGRPVDLGKVLEFLRLALEWTDHSIRHNRRADGLYHAYNLVAMDRGTVRIRRLYEMLEGQVAVLSSGLLDPAESLDLLRRLKRSALFRADQHSYLLYPDRHLPRFTERNIIAAADIRRSALLRKLAAAGDSRLIERDRRGQHHFSGALKNSGDVRRALVELSAAGYAPLVRREGAAILDLFERVFDHQSFTGRSGTFFGYEGLGCIYWHMVSKLLLAAQESCWRAIDAAAPRQVLEGLEACYRDIRNGLGDRKSPAEYGAFPMDPYSHTPGQGGARQPGLTGQVKEDILCRWGELGVFVRGGRIQFNPALLQREEFRPGNQLSFTICGIPVVYQLSKAPGITIVLADGSRKIQSGLELDEQVSRSIFQRSGRVARLEVKL
ncbi:MAG: hypothetical protein U1F98_08870 [Verrucomicrobiota bacterium]